MKKVGSAMYVHKSALNQLFDKISIEEQNRVLKYIEELKGLEKFVFKNLYAGKLSKKLYKWYEFEKALNWIWLWTLKQKQQDWF